MQITVLMPRTKKRRAREAGALLARERIRSLMRVMRMHMADWVVVTPQPLRATREAVQRSHELCLLLPLTSSKSISRVLLRQEAEALRKVRKEEVEVSRDLLLKVTPQ